MGYKKQQIRLIRFLTCLFLCQSDFISKPITTSVTNSLILLACNETNNVEGNSTTSTTTTKSPKELKKENTKVVSLSLPSVQRWLSNKKRHINSNNIFSISCFWKGNKRKQHKQRQQQSDSQGNPKNVMGQAIRMAKYDMSGNERNAQSALMLANHTLNWFRLDDGVMGGQSETNMNDILLVENPNNDSDESNKILHFHGMINTNGGGFTSIRARLPDGFWTASSTTSEELPIGMIVRIRGDGKTYKWIMSDGSRGGPFSRQPSWQIDIPTTIFNHHHKSTIDTSNVDSDHWQDVTIFFDQLVPSFAGNARQSADELKQQYTFKVTEIKEIGFMLSLKLSDGRPNPIETFGVGIFPFSLQVLSLTLISSSSSTNTTTAAAAEVTTEPKTTTVNAE